MERYDMNSIALSRDPDSMIAYITQLHAYIEKIQDKLKERDATISEINSQLDKYKSVLSVHSATFAQPRRERLVGISAEPQPNKDVKDIMLENPVVFPKSIETKNLLKTAIFSNDFLKNLGPSEVEEITLSMYPEKHPKDVEIIREGDVGSIVYVLEEGKLEVMKDGRHLRFLTKPGSVFGELAILYNCTRTATIKTCEECKLWAISRNCFQEIMMKSGLIRQRDYIIFLKSVPTFENLPMDVLSKIAGALEETNYKRGDYIIRQGARGDTFFIISQGQVKVTKAARDEKGHPCELTVRTLLRGDFFGEKALLGEDIRTANIIADDEHVVCLVIDRERFQKFISKIVEDVHYEGVLSYIISEPKIDPKYAQLELNDLNFIRTLGGGGFGTVKLVTIKNDSSKSYAMKVMKKYQIVQTKQEQHIINEKRIMLASDSPFIVKLYRTFKDEKYLYMLMESCLGGELWTVLRDRRAFDDESAKFYTGCVIEAFSYLHSRHIIYRDLKPENMLLDDKGYVKLTDFGFAKRLYPPGSKTWTFCGTPDYVSPEIILNVGHDFSCDLWSLGILMFELLTGAPPFQSPDPSLTTYHIILKGIDKIDFPRDITPRAHDLIKKLCRIDVTQRLGYRSGGIEDIIKHKWFDGFNWPGLRARTLPAPYIPRILHALDTSNFDDFNPEVGEVPVDLSGSDWDKDF